MLVLQELPRGFGGSIWGCGHAHGDGCGQGQGHTAHRGKAGGQEGDPRHQAGPPDQGREDQVPGGDLLFSLPIRESEIIDLSLKDEVSEITPVQKQTQAGHRTRFRALVAIRDDHGYVGYVGLGVKCSKEVATAVRGAITLTKLPTVQYGEATG
ncbi:40s ribosomal protein, partial [Lynx pardinus]